MMNKKLLLTVMIPFILLCLLIVRAEYHLSVGKQWDIAITDYDPRDLLRGHYLRFRLAYDWQEAKNKCNSEMGCSYCLTDIGKQAPKVQIVDTHIAKQCDGFMQYDNLKTSLNRFYIAETQAKLAEDLLRQARTDNTAYLRLSINKNGTPRIVDLLIDGRPLEELLKEASEEPDRVVEAEETIIFYDSYLQKTIVEELSKERIQFRLVENTLWYSVKDSEAVKLIHDQALMNQPLRYGFYDHEMYLAFIDSLGENGIVVTTETSPGGEHIVWVPHKSEEFSRRILKELIIQSQE